MPSDNKCTPVHQGTIEEVKKVFSAVPILLVLPLNVSVQYNSLALELLYDIMWAFVCIKFNNNLLLVVVVLL